MANSRLSSVLERLADHAAHDDAFADALAFLADDDLAGDPFSRPPDRALAAARRVNATRQDERRAALERGALSTGEVVALVASMSDRKAVDRRRSRRRLLGVKVGNRVYHPAWQFDRRRGDTRRGLAGVLEALAQVTPDALTADALMVAPNPGLGGRTLAELFAEGEVERVIAIIRLAGDQS